jgi:acyl-CoA reductase-like NAD-dependent aldehyde dehydrogenase
MELRNFINGKFIESISKKNIPVLNPSNQKVVGNIDEALDDEINLAFESAKKAFDKRILLDMDAKEKSTMMRAIAKKLREKKDEGGKILSQENGKTIAQCIGEFEGAGKYF